MSYEDEARFSVALRSAEVTQQDRDLIDVLSDANDFVAMIRDSFYEANIALTPQDLLIYRAPDDQQSNQRLLIASFAQSVNRTSLTLRDVVKSPDEDAHSKKVGELDCIFGPLDFNNPESLRNSVGAVVYKQRVKVNGAYIKMNNFNKALYGWKSGKKIASGITDGIDPVAEGNRLFRGLSIARPSQFYHYRSGNLIDLTS